MYYLRETKASSSLLDPPPVDAIPTPLCTTLPADDSQGEDGEVELGLYGSRIEAATLREMVEALRELRRQQLVNAVTSGGSDHMSMDDNIEIDTATSQ